jgi:hypothetical protein
MRSGQLERRKVNAGGSSGARRSKVALRSTVKVVIQKHLTD